MPEKCSPTCDRRLSAKCIFSKNSCGLMGSRIRRVALTREPWILERTGKTIPTYRILLRVQNLHCCSTASENSNTFEVHGHVGTTSIAFHTKRFERDATFRKHFESHPKVTLVPMCSTGCDFMSQNDTLWISTRTPSLSHFASWLKFPTVSTTFICRLPQKRKYTQLVEHLGELWNITRGAVDPTLNLVQNISKWTPQKFEMIRRR